MSGDSSGPAPDRQVLVVGANVGGLSLAACLHARGYDPTVVPGARTSAPRGLLTVWPNAAAVFSELGILERVCAAGTEIERWALQAGDGTGVTSLERSTANGNPFLAADRSRLRDALVEECPGGIRQSKIPRIIDTTERTPIVRFEDGVRERFDVVVGADGPASAVRAEAFDGDCDARFSTTAWTVRADRPLEAPGTVTEDWSRDGAVLTVASFARRSLGRLVHATGASAPVPVREFAADRLAGADVGGDVRGAGAGPDPPNVVVERERTLEHVSWPETWGSRGVALLGEAAHPLVALGVAPSLAAEDAYVLADELARRPTVRTALRRYEHRRRARLRGLAATLESEAELEFDSLEAGRRRQVALLRAGFSENASPLTERVVERL